MKTAPVLDVKILSLGAAERYAVRRVVAAAQVELEAQFPDLQLRVAEVDDSNEIGKVSNTLMLPSLMINGRLVCSGKFPTRDAVASWLRTACEPDGFACRGDRPDQETIKND